MVTINSLKIKREVVGQLPHENVFMPYAIAEVSQSTNIGLSARGDVLLPIELSEKAHKLFVEIEAHFDKEEAK